MSPPVARASSRMRSSRMACGEMPMVWLIQGLLTEVSATAVYQLMNRRGLTVAGQRRARSSSQAASRSRTGPASGMTRPSR